MAHSVDETIGRNLRALRLRRGMAQQDLAAMVGVTFQQLQKYETAVNRVSGSRLWLLAKALDVTIADFFPPHDHKNALCDLDVASNKDLKLIRDLVRLDAPEKEAIRNIVSTMVRTTNSRPNAL